MKKFLPAFFTFFLLLSLEANSQVTTNNSSGLAATYPSLAAAITALNGATITAPVIITLDTLNPQTAPSGGYSITATGTSTNTITISGTSNTITAPTPQTSGNLNDGIFKIIGGDYITIQGFTMQENAANSTTAAGTNNMTEWGVALLYATTTNGAQNNTIQNNTIILKRTYQNTFGIYSNSTHSATSISTAATATTAAGGNSGLAIYGNAISNVNIGIVNIGPIGIADYSVGFDVGGSDISTGNTITNYGTTGTFSSYTNVSGTVNGVLVRNVRNYNISNNTITSSNGGTTAGTLRGIYVPSFTSAFTGTVVNSINNNTISCRSGVNGAILGIAVEPNTTTNTSSTSIYGNDFNTFGHTVAGTSAITFISNVGVALNIKISKNTFTSITVNTTGTVTFISNAVAYPANAIVNVDSNAIVTSFTKTGAGPSVSFYANTGTSIATAKETNIGNNFSHVTVSGTSTISGWNNSNTNPIKTVTNNTFTDITGGTNAVTLMGISAGSAGSVVSNNIINDITSGAAITGITTTSGTHSFFDNTINDLSTTSGTVNCFTIQGAATQNIFRNKIYDIESNSATGIVNGLNLNTGTASATVNVYNNLVSDLRAPSTNNSTASAVIGMNVTATAANGNINIYNNTVLLSSTSSGADFSTTCVFHTGNATATTGNLTLRNNLFVNLSTPNGTGIVSAYRRGATTFANYNSNSNNNAFYAGTPGASNLIFNDGTNSDQTLSDYKTRVTPIDASSVTENPAFRSTSASNPDYLKIDSTTSSQLESGGITILSPAITNDFYNVARYPNSGYPNNPGSNAIAPDIGANEFGGIMPELNAAAGNVTLSLLRYSNVTIGSGTTGTDLNGTTIYGTLTIQGGAGAVTGLVTYGPDAIINYTGTSSYTAGSEMPSTVPNVTVNNSGGVILNSSATISGMLTLTSGNLSLGINNITTASVSGGSALSYVSTTGAGRLTINNVGASNILFPVGNGSYTPATINNSGTADNFSLGVSNTIVNPTLNDNHAVQKEWNITEASAGGSNVTLTLQWATANEGSLMTHTGIFIGHWNGSSYDPLAAALGGSDPAWTATVNSVTSFSPFIVTDDIGLPVELSSFTSNIERRNVNLNWATISELNNAGFDIERKNSVHNLWLKIGYVSGNGTSNSQHTYKFEDRNIQTGKYNYRLKQTDYNGNYEYFNLANEVEVGVPGKFELSQNYPNPFNPATKINYDLPKDGFVLLKIYDLTGRQIAELVNQQQLAGYYTANFNASNLSSGVYFYTLQTGEFVSTKKMVLVK